MPPLNHTPEDDSWSICEIPHQVALVDEANARLTSNMLKRSCANQPLSNAPPGHSEMHSMRRARAITRETRAPVWQ